MRQPFAQPSEIFHENFFVNYFASVLTGDMLPPQPGWLPPLMNTFGTSPQELPDILGRPDIVKLVDAFYAKVRADAPLGHVFDGVAKVDWETHLPKLYSFWETVLFRAGTFRGNPLAVHLKLIEQTDMGWPLFERWLELFRETVTENFEGENAGHIIRCAEDMARVIHSKIHAIAGSFHDPANLSSEQKARHASDRETPAAG